MSDNAWERIGASIDAAIEGRTKPPKSDTDLREQVARAISPLDPNSSGEWGRGMVSWEESYLDQADAALAVAEPLIRAKVIEELAQEAPEVVSDDELWGVYHSAYSSARWDRDAIDREEVPGEVEANAIMAGIRAVRRALGPPLPAIPEGWYIVHAWSWPNRSGDYAEVVIAQVIRGMTYNETKGEGTNLYDALAAAIEAAEGGAWQSPCIRAVEQPMGQRDPRVSPCRLAPGAEGE